MKFAVCRFIYLVIVGFLGASTASANLIIDVTGNAGSGNTLWSLSGTSTAISDGTITTGGFFSSGDTFEWGNPNGGSFISDTGIQNAILSATGTASITVGADTESITSVFLDDDGGFDDLGFRVASSLNYLTGETSSWIGSFTINIDINQLTPGSYELAGVSNGFFNGANYVNGSSGAILNIGSVPEPGTIALFGLGLLGLGFVRRKKA